VLVGGELVAGGVQQRVPRTEDDRLGQPRGSRRVEYEGAVGPGLFMNSCCCYQSVVAGRYRCVKERCVWFDRLEPDMVTDGTGEGGSCACRN
jgi:hypothetical protein